MLSFVLDENLGLPACDEPWKTILSAAGIDETLAARQPDTATKLEESAGTDYGYINTSCTSSYIAPAILLTRLGKTWATFLHFVAVAAWQGQFDSVVGGHVRTTMVLHDVWRSTPENAETTRVIGQYDNCKPPVVIARKDLDALVAWEPDWTGIQGALKPYYYADVHPFFHDLDQLPVGV
ncbi:hypothetical protein BST36_24085 [Mycolicibacterium moriokaense]|uniref:Uncharacterized protein n=1 Tax=Mycolicibacterium moriokaense TaxID=39691 RepID=A0AAD1H863_9MYCO|nr:PhnD/SsuA/transferrin family substrate-binding protein [Mycolicibacterium moriokaense]MCV7041553.1 PhnD/SsuA/transferrin family substrate-binding protein [Mycolicibacterium moriokaense]ORB18414.1 hypothetical protein BST36_24085 [Mycolicibacterium moriokaense]BBX00254.1 hypothetical protein MMOR_11900 [Mycolicibacterium moriokaense]